MVKKSTTKPNEMVRRETVIKLLYKFTPDHWAHNFRPKKMLVIVPLHMIAQSTWTKGVSNTLAAISFVLNLRKSNSMRVAIGDLATALSRSPSAIDRDLKRLEKDGLITVARKTGKPMIVTSKTILDDSLGWKSASKAAVLHLENIGHAKRAALPAIRRPRHKMTEEELDRLDEEMKEDVRNFCKQQLGISN